MAFRQLRQIWRLLLFIAIAVILTAALVCAVPLYDRMTEAANLRNTLLATPTSNLITATQITHQLSAASYTQTNQSITSTFQQRIGSYMVDPLRTEMTVNQLVLNSDSYPTHLKSVLVNLVGTPAGDAQTHLVLRAGRFPQTTNGDYEVAVPQEAATKLGVNIGSQLQINWAYFDSYDNSSTAFAPVTVTVVGIFADPQDAPDPYWSPQTFGTSIVTEGNTYPPTSFLVLPFLTTSDSILNEIEHLRNLVLSPNGEPRYLLNMPNAVEVDWHTYLDPNRLSFDQLDDVITSIENLQTDILDDEIELAPGGVSLTLTGATVGDASILQTFQSRNGVSASALSVFLLATIGLVLFFVGVMTDLLVSRQSKAIVVLRSRGASRADIFAALALQSLAMIILAVSIGPLLAVAFVYALARHSLQARDLPVLHPLQTAPLQSAWSVALYAVLLAVAVVITMILAIWQTAASDILTLRREASRSTSRSLWQRLNLDAFVIVAAFVAFGLSTYINDSGILNTTTSIELTAIEVVAPFCLFLAIALLFLRLLPKFLKGLQLLAVRGRAAVAMLAVTLVARAPRQIVRMTLLLALATAMIIFTQVFISSQQQRIYTVAAYQTEADFSGTINTSLALAKTPPFATIQQWTAAYKKIPGVQSATIGYTGTVNDALSGKQIEIQAVDADNFAKTALWPQDNGAMSLASIARQLAADRDGAIKSNDVPAYVDAALWSALRLQVNHPFVLASISDPAQNGFEFVALGEIDHLPPIADSINVPSTDGYTSAGLIVDYQTASMVAAMDATHGGLGSPFSVNTAWLKTSSDAKSLTMIRADLNKGNIQLVDLQDRRAIINSLLIDPPYLAIVQVLQIGAILAFILTVIGSLVSSWLDANSRATSFALLSALGASRSQLARIFLWEQGIMYLTGGVMGVILGLLLGVSIVPQLVFTSGAAVTNATILTNGEFYAIQRTPSVQVVVPHSVGYGVASICLVCVLAIWTMTRMVSHSSISRTLRLNED